MGRGVGRLLVKSKSGLFWMSTKLLRVKLGKFWWRDKTDPDWGTNYGKASAIVTAKVADIITPQLCTEEVPAIVGCGNARSSKNWSRSDNFLHCRRGRRRLCEGLLPCNRNTPKLAHTRTQNFWWTWVIRTFGLSAIPNDGVARLEFIIANHIQLFGWFIWRSWRMIS